MSNEVKFCINVKFLGYYHCVMVTEKMALFLEIQGEAFSGEESCPHLNSQKLFKIYILNVLYLFYKHNIYTLFKIKVWGR